MTPTHIRNDQRAFTLIEVTLALVLLALMLLLLYSSFALSSRAEEQITVRFEANQKIRVVEELLVGYIRSAFPYRKEGAGGAVLFAGSADQLSFVSAMSVLAGNRGLAGVTVAFTSDDESSGRLMLRERIPVRADDEDGGFSNSVTLAENITRAEISYLDVTEEREEWVSEWDGSQQEGLPKAVRIILQGEGLEPVEWVFPIMVRVLMVR